MHEEWGRLLRGDRTLGDVLSCIRTRPLAFDEWLRDLMASRGLARNRVIRDSRLNQTFAYQVIAGTRHASRDKLIQLAFGMGLDAAETCELLERGGANALMTSVRRDVAIAWCLQRGCSVTVCDDVLWDIGEDTVTSGAAGVRSTAG